jgi:ribosomal protein S18 acetylase RimI-like enzyme
MISYAITGLRSPAQSEYGKRSARDGQGSNENEAKEAFNFVLVRDYKDRAILRNLQSYARSENPGFVWFDEEKERAKLAWIRKGREGEAVGYCISKEGRYEYSAYAKRDVYVPRYISQIFVQPERRRRSIASMMICNFVSEGGTGSLWVESPKRETIALLHNLGYHESRERYQLWEMMFGLTCWARYGQIEEAILPGNQELTSATYYEPWLWSGDSAIEMAMLR